MHKFKDLKKTLKDLKPDLKPDFSDLLNRVVHDGDVEVTIYPSCGSLHDNNWQIPLRGWVHQNRRLPDRFISELGELTIGCTDADNNRFNFRIDAFTDDSRHGQSVSIQFDNDNERHNFPISDHNGLIETAVNLSAAKADALLTQQNSRDGWLSFSVVSEGHRGNGRVALIGPRGVSLVSDIDDTIKVTEVPGDKDVVLKNTFCHDFVAVSGMSEKYRSLSEASFHYVSGGPWQLYPPLSEFLSAQGFPVGTFHLNYFPKNFLAEDTRALLKDSICGSLGRTYDHKVEQITRLMQRYPEREFILVGDSGELDVEVYRRMRELFGGRVREIWIRDVVNDQEVNSFRLNGVDTIIKAEKIVCPTQEHYEKLAVIIQREHQVPYVKNTRPPCGPN
jgi:phosphatidate phosphatase APP1